MAEMGKGPIKNMGTEKTGNTPASTKTGSNDPKVNLPPTAGGAASGGVVMTPQ